MPLRFAVAFLIFLRLALCCDGFSRADNLSLPARLPAPPRPRALPSQLLQFKKAAARFPTFANLRELAILSSKLGFPDEAARAHLQAAALYRRRNLIQAALIEENAAGRYASDLRVFRERALSTPEAKRLDTKAVLEPPSGAYLGAFIDRDESLRKTFYDENWQLHRTPQEWEKLTGKAHATLFMYLRYGQKFPGKWLRACRKANVIAHLAWEPPSLDDVRDDEYLNDFARACGKLDWPIFIRFAAEPNGFRTPYHADPKRYVEKFRLVHRVFQKLAPRCATLWCVSSIPQANIDQYYPGDDGCDWVGLTLYSVPFRDNDPKRPALRDNPLSLIEPFYRAYASRKPMALCEYAASYRIAFENKSENKSGNKSGNKTRTDFALEQMRLVYGALPRLYPRIKMINWFDVNTLLYARPGRRLNDYSLSENAEILNAYRALTADSYFLSAHGKEAAVLSVPRVLSASTPETLRGRERLSIWAKTYTAHPQVFLMLDGKIFFTSRQSGASNFDFDFPKIAPGRHALTAYLYDDQNRFLLSLRRAVDVTARQTARLEATISKAQGGAR